MYMKRVIGILAILAMVSFAFVACKKSHAPAENYDEFAKVIAEMQDAPTPQSEVIEIGLEATRDLLTIGNPNAGQGDTLYAAANKIQNNFYTLFNSVYTNVPPSLVYTNLTISDGTDSVTAVEVIASTDDAVSIRTLSGTLAGATSLGTFTGDIITDSSTVKTAFQEIETDLDAVQTLSGVADAATNLGTFSGGIITSSSNIKTAIQEIETDLNAVQTLSGVADAATSLGTFTGTTIPDSSTIKSAFQSIETAVELDNGVFYILAMGQSNMVGFGTGGNIETDERVKVWNVANQEWEVWDLSLGTPQIQNGSSGRNNIAFQFAKKFAEVTSRDVRVIVEAESARPISDWVPASGTHYVGMEDQISDSGVTSIDLILWHQGESNSSNPVAYETDFDSLLSQLRAESYVDESTVFIAGQVANDGTNKNINRFYSPAYFRHKYNPDLVYLAEIGDYPIYDTAHFSGDTITRVGRVGYWNAYMHGNEQKEKNEIITTNILQPGGFNFLSGNSLTNSVSILDGVGEFTIAANFIPSQVSNNTIYSEFTSSPSNGILIYLNATKLRLLINDNGTVKTLDSNHTFIAGKLYSVMVCVTQSYQTIYVNGVLDKVGALIWTAFTPSTLPSIGIYKISGLFTGGPYVGTIKDICIWSDYLYPDDAINFAQGKYRETDLLLALTKQSVGSTIWKDISGNGNDFLQNGATPKQPLTVGEINVPIVKITDTHWIGMSSGIMSVTTNSGSAWIPLY
jgi:hypothetical protein